MRSNSRQSYHYFAGCLLTFLDFEEWAFWLVEASEEDPIMTTKVKPIQKLKLTARLPDTEEQITKNIRLARPR